MRYIQSILFCLVFAVSFLCSAQDFEQVNFSSIDGLQITADLYHVSHKAPTILMFHQSVSSRGEYRDIAPKLVAEGYNCLAVDLRWGKKDFWNKVPNETAKLNGTYEIVDNYEDAETYQLEKVWPEIWRAYSDMEAAMEYLGTNGYNGNYFAMGSSFSAMLIFKLAEEHNDIQGLLAFSPGEYHPTDDQLLAEWAKELKIPVYLSSGSGELEMLEQVKSLLPKDSRSVLHHSEGRHGASVLIDNEKDWPPLLSFFKSLSNQATIGFDQMTIERPSDKWMEGAKSKPIDAQLWYPLDGQQVPMRFDEYVKHINNEKTLEQNVQTFQRILASFSDSSAFSSETIEGFLDEKRGVSFSVRRPKPGLPLVVLSGAQPIYFTALAEELVKQGSLVVFVPRKGIQQGQRMPFDKVGSTEYKADLKAVLEHLRDSEVNDLSKVSFVSWSFEGIPTFELASELGADAFISLDSSLGYSYGHQMKSYQPSHYRGVDFDIVHFTNNDMDFGKDLDFLKELEHITGKQLIDRSYNLTHSEFTSLQSVTIPEILNKEPSAIYKNLVEKVVEVIKEATK